MTPPNDERTPADAARPIEDGLVERSGYIPSCGGSVYCTVFEPKADGAAPDTLVLLLGAFAEERKAAVRPLVDMARALAGDGMKCARIDFRGTGDSSGRSVEISLETMRADVVEAARALTSELNCDGVVLAGLRLGAAVAQLSSPGLKDLLRALVLMEPVVKGEAYERELTRKQAIRKMLTKGDASASAGAGEGPFDLDGLALDRAFLEELSGIDLTAAGDGGAVPCPTLVLQIGARKTLRPATSELASAVGGEARAEVLVAEPFWLQTDYVDPGPATEVVRSFLADVCGTERPERDEARQ